MSDLVRRLERLEAQFPTAKQTEDQLGYEWLTTLNDAELRELIGVYEAMEQTPERPYAPYEAWRVRFQAWLDAGAIGSPDWRMR